MKTSLIQHRVADFLKQYPPCCYMEGGDAFLTAQVFLKLLRLAQRSGRRTLAALTESYIAEKH